MYQYLTPYKDLLARVDALKDVEPNQLFLEAQVYHSNRHNWAKGEVPGVMRWIHLLNTNKTGMIAPQVSTWQYFKEQFGDEGARKRFMDAGFSPQLMNQWFAGDPKYIENYKRVCAVVEFYEKNQKLETV